MLVNSGNLREAIREELAAVKITDIHTHLFAPEFGDLCLWGVDELLTYHYLVAEFFRWTRMGYGEFFSLGKGAQADLTWEELFLNRSPMSEAQRGVLTALNALGLDVGARDLKAYRAFFDGLSREECIDLVLELSGVECVVMTNDPFDLVERKVWESTTTIDSRFRGALRVDVLLNDFPHACRLMLEQGYEAEESLGPKSTGEVQRFLREWLERISGLYLAASLPAGFRAGDGSVRARLIEECILPVCEEANVPLALMIGAKRQVNPKLRLAGDSVGKGDIAAVEYLCARYPQNKFLVTMLSRENQHELAITARKFPNLLIFGCWWFLNNPSLVEEITRMRMETLGLAFIPQHSDARVVEQLIYKWKHAKEVVGKVLYDKYSDLLAANWTLTREELARDIQALFGGNFWRFIKK